MTKAGRTLIFAGLLGLQALGTFVFVGDLLSSRLSLYSQPPAWSTRELMETGAAVALLLGLLLGTFLMVRTLRDLKSAEHRLERASEAFSEMLNARFEGWGLTAAERDVALFAIKGLSIQEMAQLRDTTEGTIKSQTAAIYRKAGVSGRPQLLSLFIEDLVDGIDRESR